MVFFNYSTMQLAAKIVYCGPGLSGKTTNLEWIFGHTAPKIRGEMVTLATDTDRTVFFDLLPLELGSLAGFKTRLQLYTVPGQVFYNSTRKLVLRGVDGLVFVADAQRDMHHANLESLRNLQENIAEMDMDFDNIPLIIQYNKQDLDDVMSTQEMNRYYNLRQCPFFEATATKGVGVFETLKAVSKITLAAIKTRLVKRNVDANTGPKAGPPKMNPQNAHRPEIAKVRQPTPVPPPPHAPTPPPIPVMAKSAPPTTNPETIQKKVKKTAPTLLPERGRLRKKLKVAINQKTFHRSGFVNISLVMEDKDKKPMAAFRNIRLKINDPEDLQRLLLELKVLIKPKS